MLSQPLSDFDLDFLRLFFWIRRTEHGLKKFGIQNERLKVITDVIDMNIFVNKLDRLRSESRGR